jgi:hypothetical protein
LENIHDAEPPTQYRVGCVWILLCDGELVEIRYMAEGPTANVRAVAATFHVRPAMMINQRKGW